MRSVTCFSKFPANYMRKLYYSDALVDVEAAVDREDGAGDEAGAAWVDEVE